MNARFEHLLQINDPLIPLLDELSRAQLWRGLVLRSETPEQFTLGLEGCTIEAREIAGGITTLARTLDFGNFKVRDRVRLEPMDAVTIDVPAGATWPPMQLRIRIEEPQPRLLFLRFVYEWDEPASADPLDATVRSLREQAYTQSDIDTVLKIRMLAERGALDGAPMSLQ
ncbi:MAG: AtaL-like protein [Gammaproteobacteria bacterium]